MHRIFWDTDIGEVKSGKTVVIRERSGNTGSIAGQIAKIKGCRVVETTEVKEKCNWLTRVAGFTSAARFH